jgi:hypothetical protein
MERHAAVRAGDERATVALLTRLARQAARPYPPPAGFSGWTSGAALDLVAETFSRKRGFVAAAVAETRTDAELERYLLKVLTNVLRDGARRTERGKLIGRLRTIFGAEGEFVRHVVPFDSWRLAAAPEVVWQGDIADLIATASRVRGTAATRWNTSGPTPRATRDAIVAVSRAALGEAQGLVRDVDVAQVVQVCVPAVPVDAVDAESTGFSDATAQATDVATGDEYQEGSPQPDEVAQAVWSSLTDDERAAVPYLGDGDRAVATALGMGRRAGAAVAASVQEKVRLATLPGQEESVVFLLLRWASPDDPGDAGDDPEEVGAL